MSLLAYCAIVFSGLSFSQSARSPNFIILFGDDVAWGDLGANWNPNKTASDTPNLDQLAQSGVRFTDFHAAASVCSPSRASLLTARLGIRNGVTKLFSSSAVEGLPLNETTFAEVFKAAGYNTAMIGKWHLGLNGSYHPLGRGFDHYLGVPMSNDEGCGDHPGHSIPEPKPCSKDNDTFTFHPISVSNDCEMGECDDSAGWALPLLENRTVIEQPADLWSLSDKYSHKAVELIKQMGSSEKPFLLYVAFAHMHVPLGHSARYTNTSVHGFYGDTVKEMDGIVGDIMEALRVNGLENDTMVWFTADNGPWVSKCQYAGDQGPFTGTWQETIGGGGSTAKLTPWEAGHREPAMVSWPGRIQPGQVCDSLLSTMDIFPTMAAIAGLAMPPNRKFDGIDISDVIFHGKRVYEERALFHPNSLSAGTAGDINTYRVGKYKAMYLTGQSFAAASSCGGKRGPVEKHDPPLIFNVQEDPAESTPLDSSSTEYKMALKQIQSAATFIKNDIATDNTTVASYKTDPSCRPCCNRKHVVCRCFD
ncbi:arylsulfatase G-like isoform X2 [Ptychodera flava]|uniref:arylsulfatase G-like isoform X2 n=1 Tax=Ptychodera flava TaxID=63121 RepID=UPI003969C9B1